MAGVSSPPFPVSERRCALDGCRALRVSYSDRQTKEPLSRSPIMQPVWGRELNASCVSLWPELTHCIPPKVNVWWRRDSQSCTLLYLWAGASCGRSLVYINHCRCTVSSTVKSVNVCRVLSVRLCIWGVQIHSPFWHSVIPFFGYDILEVGLYCVAMLWLWSLKYERSWHFVMIVYCFLRRSETQLDIKRFLKENISAISLMRYL